MDRLPVMVGKDVGSRIRVDRALRHEFLEVCKEKDTPGAQGIHAELHPQHP